MASQFDFLIEFILEMLEKNNVKLSDEQKKIYVPQILGQLQLRLGLALLPKLDELGKDKFAKLTNNENTTPQEWQKFWTSSVPNFKEEVETVLLDFAEKAKNILNK